MIDFEMTEKSTFKSLHHYCEMKGHHQFFLLVIFIDYFMLMFSYQSLSKHCSLLDRCHRPHHNANIIDAS